MRHMETRSILIVFAKKKSRQALILFFQLSKKRFHPSILNEAFIFL
jgi:hypothetical protein